MHIATIVVLLVGALSIACDDNPAAPVAATTPSAISAPSTPTPTQNTPAPPSTPPVSVAAQHVLVAYKGAQQAPSGVTRSKADARKRAEEVRGKAKAGEDFSALVATYSDDPGAKERLGSVGKFTREKMTKPFSDAAFALPVDGVSDVVETGFGFHVIKRNQ